MSGKQSVIVGVAVVVFIAAFFATRSMWNRGEDVVEVLPQPEEAAPLDPEPTGVTAKRTKPGAGETFMKRRRGPREFEPRTELPPPASPQEEQIPEGAPVEGLPEPEQTVQEDVVFNDSSSEIVRDVSSLISDLFFAVANDDADRMAELALVTTPGQVEELKTLALLYSSSGGVTFDMYGTQQTVLAVSSYVSVELEEGAWEGYIVLRWIRPDDGVWRMRDAALSDADSATNRIDRFLDEFPDAFDTTGISP